MATFWIAALLIAERWAAKMGDTELADRIGPLVERAQQRMEADLWNGRYYRAFGSPAGPANDNAHAGMLAGECFARMLAGLDVLPADRLAACNQAWLALQGSPRFAVPPDEVAPDGALRVEFGWLPYDALLDFFFTPADGVLRLVPKLRGSAPIVHPLFWATARSDGAAATVTLTVEKLFADPAPAVRQIETTAAGVSLAGTPAARAGQLGLYHRYVLPQPVRLRPGATIRWEVDQACPLC